MGYEQSDADLIAACEEFANIRRKINDADASIDLEVDHPLCRAFEESVTRICSIQARTSAGLAARVRAIILHSPNVADPSQSKGYQDRITHALFKDILGCDLGLT
jgi:hypothetical protein